MQDPPYHIDGGWDIKARALKLEFPLLTHEDVECKGGEEEEMIARLCKRLSRDRDEILSFIARAGKPK